MKHTLFSKNFWNYQIKILDHSGSTFSIYLVDKISDWKDKSVQRSDDIFYLDEDETFPYLCYFIIKNFPNSLQIVFDGTNRYNLIKEYFEWYDNNYYTFTQIDVIIKDIKQHIELLKNDFYNPNLDEFRKLLRSLHIDYHFVDLFYLKKFDKLSIDEQDAFIRNHLFIIVDFYERLIFRIQRMMYNNPDFGFICFSGP